MIINYLRNFMFQTVYSTEHDQLWALQAENQHLVFRIATLEERLASTIKDSETTKKRLADARLSVEHYHEILDRVVLEKEELEHALSVKRGSPGL